MSRREVQFDPHTVLYRVVVAGRPLADPDGWPLGFEDHQRAQEVAEDGGEDE